MQHPHYKKFNSWNRKNTIIKIPKCIAQNYKMHNEIECVFVEKTDGLWGGVRFGTSDGGSSNIWGVWIAQRWRRWLICISLGLGLFNGVVVWSAWYSTSYMVIDLFLWLHNKEANCDSEHETNIDIIIKPLFGLIQKVKTSKTHTTHQTIYVMT